jgi:dTDP-4-dehydrorhamnose 3,5-epimerase
VSVVSGEVFDVAVDIRAGSPTFGRHVDVMLSEDNHKQLYIPPGFAHGFCVVSDTARFAYKCTAYYNAAADRGIIWNDPDIGIEWPVDGPLLSEKDLKLPRLKDIPAEKLPRLEGGS